MEEIETKNYYKYLPFTVTPQEISFALKCCELESDKKKDKEELSKQKYGQYVLRLYQGMNHFGSGDESFEKFFTTSKIGENENNVLIDITDNDFDNKETLK